MWYVMPNRDGTQSWWFWTGLAWLGPYLYPGPVYVPPSPPIAPPIDAALTQRVYALEQKLAAFEKRVFEPKPPRPLNATRFVIKDNDGDWIYRPKGFYHFAYTDAEKAERFTTFEAATEAIAQRNRAVGLSSSDRFHIVAYVVGCGCAMCAPLQQEDA